MITVQPEVHPLQMPDMLPGNEYERAMFPKLFASMEEGLQLLHWLYLLQEEWMWGRVSQEHAREVLKREPTLRERAWIWILWPGGLKQFWSEMSPESMEYLRSRITGGHFVFYQSLLALVDPVHLYCVEEDFGYTPRNDPGKIVHHFIRHTGQQMRLRFRSVFEEL